MFAKYITQCKHLEEFWISTVEESLKAPTKLREILILKIITDILEYAEPSKLQISKLLSHNFVKVMVTTLKGLKLKKDETLKAFYEDFFNALYTFSTKIQDDTEKVEIIHKLILYPGIPSIEKYSSQRIIHQIINNLNENGVKQIFETYKKIFLNKLTKNPDNVEDVWLNVERQNAGYLLHTLICHKNVKSSFDWRAEQLKFMMTFGLFYVNEEGEIVKDTTEDSNIISDEFASQLKNIFYTSLQSKVLHIKHEKNILLSLVKVCNDVLQKKHYNKYLRNQIDESDLKLWNNMFEEVCKTKQKEHEEKTDILRIVFHLLLLHMGLQLFREPEMARTAILDLEQCMAKAKEKHKVNRKKIENDIEQEPEWIEVVTDLFLHLLSQNNSALRNVVNSVFPHLCNNLTLTAIHQILSVLDMKDGHNPLSEGDENQEVNNEGSDENDDDDDDTDLSERSDESSDDENDNDEDEEIIEEEEEGTATDKLRNAVSVALGTVGKDADQESVDLDDMDEEEGKKLDEALTEAFKLIKKSGENKRSKEYRVKATTVMHFRIRVLDLIEIYVQQNPSLLICLEIMSALYDMIEFCGDNELKPLSLKVEKVLTKLTTLRHFSSIEDVTEQNICDFLRIIMEKKVRASVFEVLNKLRAKCCIFLISCEKLFENASSNKLLTVFEEYLNDFIKLRNPTLNMTLLCDIFKMRWKGIWHLANILSQNGLSIDKTRVFRRIQILELLDLLYKNYELIKQDLVNKKNFKIIENCLQNHIQSLTEKDHISVREFNTILNVLLVAHRCHIKIPVKNYFNKETICNNIQDIRKKVKLDNVHSYNKFCNVFDLKNIKNFEIKPSLQSLENGNDEIMSNDDANNQEESSHQNSNAKNKKATKIEIIANNNQETISKRKNTITKDLRKEKKLRKEERLQKASEGLNGELTFVETSDTIGMANGNVNNSDSSD